MKNRFTWKHIGLVMVAVALLVGLFVVPGSADDIGGATMNQGDFNTYFESTQETDPNTDETYYVITRVRNLTGPTKITIPAQVSTMSGLIPVREIGQGAFQGTGIYVSDVEFHEGLRVIGDHAFYGTAIGTTYGFGNKGVITIPSTVTTIGDYAFANCNQLIRVAANDNADNNAGSLAIGAHAFENCVPDSNAISQNSGNTNFNPDSNIVSVDIRRPVTIGDYAFDGSLVGRGYVADDDEDPSNDIPALNIPYVTTIGDYAFGRAKLDEFTIPATLTSIGAHAFSGNDSDSGLTVAFEHVPDGETPAGLAIGAYAFSNWTEAVGDTPASQTNSTILSSVTLPDDRDVTIGNYAFAGNDDPFELDLGQTVTVGNYAFAQCGVDAGASYAITWPASMSITSVGDYAFDGCGLLGTVDASNVTTIGNGGFRASSISSLTLPNWSDNMRMGDYAFAGLTQLTEVTVPANWAALPAGFFKALDGAGVDAPGLTTVTFEGATAIGANAFEGCENLTTVSAATVPSVGANAFKGCTSLINNVENTSVFALPAATSIGDSAFEGCTGLRQVMIDAATTIGDRAFYGANGMTSLSMSAATTIGDSAFENTGAATGVTALTWPTTITDIGVKAFYNSKLLGTVDLTNAAVIGASAFENSNITSVTLPTAVPAGAAYVTMDGQDAPVRQTGDFALSTRIFADCDGLTAPVTTPLAWTLIPDETFYDCDGIPAVTISGAEAAIGDKAFFSCDVLTTVDAQSAASVGAAAFFGCGKIATLNFSSLKSIGTEAFVDVGSDNGIQTRNYNVDLSSVTNIGNGAFLGSELFDDNAALTLTGCTVGKAAFGGQSFASVTLNNGCSVGEAAFAGAEISGVVTVNNTDSEPNVIGTDAGDPVFNGTSYTFTQGTRDAEALGAATIGGLVVTGTGNQIKDSAFSGVTISAASAGRYNNTISIEGANTSIGASAFSSATLTNVAVSVSGTGASIGTGAFAGTSFASLWLGGANTTVADAAFQNTTITGNVTVSGAGTTIGTANATVDNGAFNGANIGGNLSIANTSGAVTVNQTAFRGVAVTGDLTISGTAAIGQSAFQTATVGGDLTISGANAAIGQSAFQSTTITGNVTISGGNATLGTSAFQSTTIGQDLAITGGGTIGQSAFQNAAINGDGTNAGTVTIGSTNAGNTTVGESAFQGATFRTLDISTSPVAINGSYAFAKAGSAVDLYPGENETATKQRDHTLTTVNLSAVTSIGGSYAFSDRAGISTITLPPNHPTGSYTFRGCTSIGSSLTVPDGWTALKTGTFYCCDGLTNLHLPNVTEVGNYVFSTRGTSGSHTKIKFDSEGIGIANRAFESYGPNGTHPYSYLEIWVDQNPYFSISGWRQGWGAYQTENSHYWIYWKIIETQDSLSSIYDRSRVLIDQNDSDSSYYVYASRLVTHIDIYNYLGYRIRQANADGTESPLGEMNWDTQNVPSSLRRESALNSGNVLAARGTRTNPTASQQAGVPMVDEVYYYYAYTEISLTQDDDISSWDYRYGLFCKDKGITREHATLTGDNTYILPIMSNSFSIGNYLAINNSGTYEYDFDKYLRNYYPLSASSGSSGYNVTAIIAGTPPTDSDFNPGFQPESGSTGFEKIFVPDTVRQIGANAFKNATGLTHLTGERWQGNSIQAYDDPALYLTSPIGTSAFEGCSNLAAIKFDNSYETSGDLAGHHHRTTVGNRAFYGCSNLASIGSGAYSVMNYPGELYFNDIGESAFENCANLPSLTFKRVGNIGDYAFKNALRSGSNKSVTFDGLTHETSAPNAWPRTYEITIGKAAFYQCSKLASISFNNNLDGLCTIGAHYVHDDSGASGTFYGCAALTTVNFGRLDLDVGYSSFRYCNALTTVNWTNNNVRYLDQRAFQRCDNLRTVNIYRMGTDSDKSVIEKYAFYQCPKLQNFTVSNGHLTKIGMGAFTNTFSHSSVGSGTFTMNATVDLIDGNSSTNTTYPERTFGGTSKLMNINFANVGRINGYAFAFSDNENLTGRSLTIDTLGVTGYDPDGDGATPVGNGLLMPNALRDGRFERITINNGTIPTVGEGMFIRNHKLKYVTLPTVGTLGRKAFASCPLVEEVVFDSITTIEDYAFSDEWETPTYCTSLKLVQIPGVQTISHHAFYKAGANSGVTPLVWTGTDGINATVTTIGESAFEECKLLGTVEVKGGTGVSVGNKAFKNSSVTEVTFQSAPPETTGNYWFENCAGLTNVAFPTGSTSTWTAIPEGTFKGCANLGSQTNASGASVDFGTVTTIGASAFENAGTASGITPNTAVPNTITSVGSAAFKNCGFLTTADLSRVATAGIGNQAFMGSSVSSLTLPAAYNPVRSGENATVTVGVSAFEGCANLTSLTVPSGWTKIPNSMFAAAGLTTLTIGESTNLTVAQPVIGMYAFSGCEALTNVTIYGAVEVGDSAFTGRDADTTVGVTALDPAFAANATVTMDQVRNVGSSAFYNCAKLATVNMAAIEKIGGHAFANCTSLAHINYKDASRTDVDELLLKNHNKYRYELAGGYTASEFLDNRSFLYYYDSAHPNDWMQYTDAAKEAVETDPSAADHNWKFSMCTLPNTVRAIGQSAFAGTPITDLYIADLYLQNAPGGNNSQLTPPANGEAIDANALAGIDSLRYIFVQHGFHGNSGAPWGATEADVEWDDGIIGDAESGLYYNYQTGKVVGIYDYSKTIVDNFPRNLHDGRNLKRNLPSTGIDPYAFFWSQVRDIEIPAWLLDLLDNTPPDPTYTIGNPAFRRNDTADLLRISILGFYNEDVAKKIAKGFGLEIPAGSGMDDPANLTPAEKAELERIWGITIPDGATWQEILDLILAPTVQNAKIEWLEQPQIEFGEKTTVTENGTETQIPRVSFEIERQPNYPLSGEQFKFSVVDVPEYNAVADVPGHDGSFDPGVLPKSTILGANNITWMDSSQTVGSAPIKLPEFDAAYDRHSMNGGTGYDPNDIKYMRESHIMKLTADEIGIADYYSEFDTIYCRVTYKRDNEREKYGAQNAEFSINYTTVYEFFDPYAYVESVCADDPGGYDPSRYYDYIDSLINGDNTDLNDLFSQSNIDAGFITNHISFKGLFGEPQKLIYDLNTARALAVAAEKFPDVTFTAGSVNFAAGMLPEVWMTSAYETRIQGGVPTCETTVTDPATNETTVYKLAFAGWSTKQTDTSVYDTETDGTKQFKQPYEVVKPGNRLPQETTLYAVWKTSEAKEVYIKYDDSASGVRLSRNDTSLTPFTTEQLKPKKYGSNFNGYFTDPVANPEGDTTPGYPLTDGAGNVLNMQIYTASGNARTVYLKYVEPMANSYKWVNVQKLGLVAGWTDVSDAPMVATITFRAPGMEDQVRYTKYNDWNVDLQVSRLYSDPECTTPLAPTAPNSVYFDGWYTAEEFGLKVLETNGTTLAQGSGTDVQNNQLTGWNGGVNGWTIGKWVQSGTNYTWETPRWMVTGSRILYAQFTDTQPQGN